jgi:hypothetical protein
LEEVREQGEERKAMFTPGGTRQAASVEFLSLAGRKLRSPAPAHSVPSLCGGSLFKRDRQGHLDISGLLRGKANTKAGTNELQTNQPEDSQEKKTANDSGSRRKFPASTE